ncbi:MAG: OmpH family outer membrane protein [Acidobacteria bacterium]|nr:OmpH family outer membrane protein [Acidobacteriota bacterium]
MFKRLFAVMLMIFALTVMTYAQGSAVKSTAQGSGAIPTGKVAIIDSRAFGDGIGEMKKQLDKLEVDFQPRFKELEGLQQQLVALDDDIKKEKDLRLQQQKADKLQTTKRDFERKREDFQQDYQKRSEVALGPIRDKVLKFLESYAASRDIVVVFDLAPAAQSGLVFLNPGTNITEDFIKEYNKQNSAGAPPEPAVKK